VPPALKLFVSIAESVTVVPTIGEVEERLDATVKLVF